MRLDIEGGEKRGYPVSNSKGERHRSGLRAGHIAVSTAFSCTCYLSLIVPFLASGWHHRYISVVASSFQLILSTAVQWSLAQPHSLYVLGFSKLELQFSTADPQALAVNPDS